MYHIIIVAALAFIFWASLYAYRNHPRNIREDMIKDFDNKMRIIPTLSVEQGDALIDEFERTWAPLFSKFYLRYYIGKLIHANFKKLIA